MKFFLSAVIPSIVNMKAALGVNQIVVVLPVIVLQAILHVSDSPVIAGVPVNVEVRDFIPSQITPI